MRPGLTERFMEDSCSSWWEDREPCVSDDPVTRRLHDRARLFLRQTAPKPARRKKA